MFHCTSNTCIRKNSGTYLFDEVTTDEQTTSKLVVPDCRQNAFGQHSRSVFLVLGSKSGDRFKFCVNVKN